MAQININIRMDENLKKEFETTCNEIGLTMTAAFTVFAKAVSKYKGIPFKLSAEKIKESDEIWGNFQCDVKRC